ncbi:hypothetical protein Glove_57g9 [Diversispora epigaea]|uniref:TLDc domain-containing protein n=1 Tax=Diversispora epigaea TaxID=1348612 RepID=A0A397JJ35_9GLOM|nr:hypothetical protein Glove_57g9 [Diversispora epigaea]
MVESGFVCSVRIGNSLTKIVLGCKIIDFTESINEFAPKTFWDICNGHASTVVIMEVKGTNEILGGYNPLIWDANIAGYNNRLEKTDDSFIFSLKNGNIQNSILSRVKFSDKAILNICKNYQHNNDPRFGYDLYMHSPSSNFTLDNNSVYNNNGHYEKPIRTTTDNFPIVDYEVFKIIRNFDPR